METIRKTRAKRGDARPVTFLILDDTQCKKERSIISPHLRSVEYGCDYGYKKHKKNGKRLDDRIISDASRFSFVIFHSDANHPIRPADNSLDRYLPPC